MRLTRVSAAVVAVTAGLAEEAEVDKEENGVTIGSLFSTMTWTADARVNTLVEAGVVDLDCGNDVNRVVVRCDGHAAAAAGGGAVAAAGVGARPDEIGIVDWELIERGIGSGMVTYEIASAVSNSFFHGWMHFFFFFFFFSFLLSESAVAILNPGSSTLSPRWKISRDVQEKNFAAR